MVSENNVLTVESTCSCGSGDKENNVKNYFENKCPACGKEGVMQIETINNVEVNQQSNDETNSENNSLETQTLKIVCKNCGSEYCGQDGYDLSSGRRGGLASVNPNEISNDEEEEVSSNEENETTYMSGWEGLCDLLRPLDAEAMIVQRGDYVIVKKIEMPQTARLWAYEGINVVDDSVSITDYTPEIYNTFVIKWGESFENELNFTFNKHKQLFGERKTVMEATKVVLASDEESEEGDDSDKKNESGGIFDLIFNSGNDKSNSSKNNVDTSSISEEIDGESEDEAPETEEVPITTKEEAIQFGMKQVGKAKREDGHTIELKVIGNLNWQMGEWCHVKLPSFNEDAYMFISKCSFESSPDSEYINSLTLVDYPPSLGKPLNNTEEESSEEESEESEEDTENEDSNENNNENESND